MTRLKLLGVFLAIAICATAAGVALASSGKSTKSHARTSKVTHTKSTARTHTRAATKSARHASASDETTGESESTNGETDNVEQTGDANHQCPPDCSPGENP